MPAGDRVVREIQRVLASGLSNSLLVLRMSYEDRLPNVAVLFQLVEHERADFASRDRS